MLKAFHEACHEALARRFSQSPVLFERLPLSLPHHDSKLLHITKETLECALEAGFTTITYHLPENFLKDIKTLSQSKENSMLESFVLDYIINNSLIAHEGIYPLCQDTGTASVYSWRGNGIITDTEKSDYTIFSEAVAKVWTRARLRNSQLAPTASYTETNTGNNLPLLLENFSVPGTSWDFIITAKGGGSSNKSTIIQATKSSLNQSGITNLFKDYIRALGVSACPPYTIGIAIGGQSPEESMFAAKLASSEMLDYIGEAPEVPFRDHELETLCLRLAESSGWGAQFGGRRLIRKAIVLRLTRHAASLPISFAVSCTAHRWAQLHIDPMGIYLERMADPTHIDSITEASHSAVTTAATQPVSNVAPERPIAIAGHPSGTEHSESLQLQGTARVSFFEPGMLQRLNESTVLQTMQLSINDLSACRSITAGTLVRASGIVLLARDAVHARLLELIHTNIALPDWAYQYPVFYASPTETPEGCCIGSIGPTTSKRMDPYVKTFLKRSIFTVMIGKGEREQSISEACKTFGGVYFAAPGGCSAILAKHHVTESKIIDWHELDMEAVRLITIKDMPLLCIIDSAGNDFYKYVTIL